MELRHLRYFVTVAEELHFGRAAQRLQMAQQPLSRQIRELEAEIEVQLFHRTKRTVRLTEAGKVFLIEAQKTLQQANQAILLAQRTQQGDRGELRIGFTSAALNRVLPQAIRQFKMQHPNIQLVLERLTTNEQVEALIEHRIQIGLLHPPIAQSALRLETLHREPLMVFLPDSHRLAKSQVISIRSLSQESFIFYPRSVGPVLYDQMISFCQQAGFSPNIVQEVFPQQTILGLVSAGLGVSLLHASACAVAPQGVVCRSLSELTPELELAAAWHPEQNSPSATLFLQGLQHLPQV
ncbi:LysR family transcriptional regulator [Leptolyngbya sp. NIES-2104]|uniref:LysR family transcriptional regulator n=1 Tax=Leptolyngbya sp. NIES-2104 TaxID=1552121 RepID=UPI0006EC5458|nr:LysR family transcriptional regulator [Leptolyngbya sp. NIES-2104]GAP97999.1 aromatic hydrocarbon utilization transcriptional regulator CatR [Leptolyngbya sp. NIES-2104]